MEAKVRRVTLNLSEPLLQKALEISQEGITETISQALALYCRREALLLAQKLKGKISLEPDKGRKLR